MFLNRLSTIHVRLTFANLTAHSFATSRLIKLKKQPLFVGYGIVAFVWLACPDRVVLL